MKKTCLLISILFTHFFSAAQWTPININVGTDTHFEDLFFINNEVGFVAGGQGFLPGDEIMMKTTDGGITWNEVETGLSSTIYGVWFTNASTGFAAGEKIQKTTDQGATWNTVFSCPSCTFDQLFFVNENIGYVNYYEGTTPRMLKTTNGGNTWTIKSSFNEGYLNDIYFLTEISGIISYFDNSAFDTYVMGTHNGGNSWGTLLSNGELAKGYRSVVALNSQTILAAGSFAVAITTDEGDTWTEYAYPVTGSPSPNDMAFTSTSDGWIVGNYILKTTDGGHTWTNELTVNGELNAVKFPSADTGYAVGYEGKIFKHINSGNPTPPGVTMLLFNEPSFCPGETFTISYATTGVFESGNVFTVELSDANGSFSSPVTIGSVASVSSGSIQMTFPPLINEGSGYRIRVVGSNPITIGPDNGHDLEINCPAPENPEAKKITASSAKLKWFFVDCANGYRIRYREEGTSEWTKVTTADQDKVLNDLAANTTYQWSVQTKCVKSPKVYSEWSPNETFTTAPFKVTSAMEQKELTVFPNPNNGSFEIQLSEALSSSNSKIFITDILGRTVYVSERIIDNNSLHINLAKKIPDGIYLITVQSAHASTSLLFEVQEK